MVDKNSELLIDKEGGIRRTGGEFELYNELMDLFFEQSKEQIAALNNAIKNNQSQSVRELAHSIKGAAGNLGVKFVQESAMILEDMGSASQLEHAEEAYSKLISEIERVEQFWKNSE